MQTLLAAVTILVLASVAKDEVAQVVTGWDPFAVTDLTQ
jgi:hypothetical protein